jgi:hypothetical protein
LSYVATGIFRGNPQHPPLLKELSGLAMMLGGIRWPDSPETEYLLHGTLRPGEHPEWGLGNVIIADNGSGRVWFGARLPFVLIASMLAVLIYLWGRQLAGELAALCAVFRYTTPPSWLTPIPSPPMLAWPRLPRCRYSQFGATYRTRRYACSHVAVLPWALRSLPSFRQCS